MRPLDNIRQESQKSLDDEQQQQKPLNAPKQDTRLNSIVQMNLMKKQSLAVSFSGIIRSGSFKNDYTLYLQYSFYANENWVHEGGQPSGVSLKSSVGDDRIVWNLPFGVTYLTKSIGGWPQIAIVLYRTDYFGRSMPYGYGNVHLPLTEGVNRRKIRVFTPLQPSSFWNCLNWCTSSVCEIKEPEKYLGEARERKNLRVQYCGEVEIEVETKLINLKKHGYI